MEKLREWKDLGVVDTIYEEEHEDLSNSTPSLSNSLSLPPTPLHCRVEAWATGCESDVLIHVQGSRFCLHKDPLSARSGYLKRHLNELSEITLSPPLNITAETFTLVAEFCYGVHFIITPFNVASLRVAAELLEMTETNGTAAAAADNLWQKTEAYFRRTIAISREYALIVFRSALSLLPEAETAAALVSRCMEALSIFDDGDGVIMSCVDGLKTVQAEDFQIIAESLQGRLSGSHDLLYRIVDLYLKEHGGKLTEEQKTQICNSIDCTTLSPQLLMHAVQNPVMPLRFVVQAMFIDQLNTRRSIVSAAANRRRHHPPKPPAAASLGAILERDAAIRQAAYLQAAMDATSSRIRLLEKELDGMKKLLHESESARSASSRFSSENRIERVEKGSVSSNGFRIFPRREKVLDGHGHCMLESSTDGVVSPRVERSFGKKLISRLKGVFGKKKNSESREERKVEAECRGGDIGEEGYGNGEIVVIKKDLPFHNRSRSLG